MDAGFRSPLVDFFRRGDVAQDVRLLAAKGGFAPRAHEQLALLLLLVDDPDQEVSETARATLDRLPAAALGAFLARADVPGEMRAFFAARGIAIASTGAPAEDAPILDEDDTDPDEPSADPKILSLLPIMRRMKIAMKGTREQRAQLIRDSNKLVAICVLSSPKLTETEVESFAKMANLSEEVLRVIATNRSWTKSYTIVAALARNPKTPVAISMQLLPRLIEKDMKLLSIDRNIPEAVRIAARRFLLKSHN